MNALKRYLINILILLDLATNSIVLFGSPEETISSRSAKARNAGKRWGCVLCRFLDWCQPNHCNLALMPASAGDDAIIPDDKVSQ